MSKDVYDSRSCTGIYYLNLISQATDIRRLCLRMNPSWPLMQIILSFQILRLAAIQKTFSFYAMTLLFSVYDNLMTYMFSMKDFSKTIFF